MGNKISKFLFKYAFVLLLTVLFSIITFGKEEEINTDDWGQDWLGGDFSDVEGGYVNLHVSFSENARKLFGIEKTISLQIESVGKWGPYYGRNNYCDDLVILEFDKKKDCYRLHKKLPYGNYVITDWNNSGDTSNFHSIDDYLAYRGQPEIHFQISKEEPEIPVFMEIQNYGKLSGREVDNYNEIFKKYTKIYDEYEKKRVDPLGKVEFHVSSENLGNNYFVVAELSYGGSQKIMEIHYFGKTNNYTYTTELYPGIYGICRVLFIDKEGTVLAEDEAIKGYKFECNPQKKIAKINLTDSKEQEGNPPSAIVNLPEESVSETSMENTNTETTAVKTTTEVNTAINNTDVLQGGKLNQKRIILYNIIAFIVVVAFTGGAIYLFKSK